MNQPLMSGLFEKLHEVTDGLIQQNESMTNHTYYRTGGPVRAYLEPASTEDFVKCVQWINEHELPFEVIGAGSNILWADDPYAGVVLSTHPAMTDLTIDGDEVQSGAGVRMSRLLAEVHQHELGGFSFLYGIPGTIGGGVRMNAGTSMGWMSDVLVDVEVMTAEGKRETREAKELGLDYRFSNLQEDEIVLSARMKATGALDTTELKELKKAKEYRKNTQPLQFPSGGSVFRNPEGDAAGRLIESAGLKGRLFGGAQISELHANFIVARENACSKDILHLIRETQAEVYRVHEVWLEPEIKLMGPWSSLEVA